jgi:hypothetical protein
MLLWNSIEMIRAYRREIPVHLGLKDHHHKRREHQRNAQYKCAQLPGDLALSSPRICPSHDEDCVKRRRNEEDLEEEVPCVYCVEDVQISRTEDDGIEDLRYEGDACMLSVSCNDSQRLQTLDGD